jgi:hypothetical protein
MFYGNFSRFLCMAAVAFSPQLALAQFADSPTSLGVSGAWEAFTYEADGAKVCYVTSAPKKTEASKKGIERGPVHFLITHWPSKKVKAQPSVMSGYKYKDASEVKLSVGEKEFVLYPVDSMAWTDKVETEKAILAAMKSGKDMVVSGTSAKGTTTRDSYSLSGIKAALAAIDSACK